MSVSRRTLTYYDPHCCHWLEEEARLMEPNSQLHGCPMAKSCISIGLSAHNSHLQLRNQQLLRDFGATVHHSPMVIGLIPATCHIVHTVTSCGGAIAKAEHGVPATALDIQPPKWSLLAWEVWSSSPCLTFGLFSLPSKYGGQHCGKGKLALYSFPTA